ncbi:MAG: TspO/MBR family protein [Alphaproteobacteria bacterium]|jgi:tryptophan-rich sensory protein|nr:TspO/MBR family protein [Alphaproteobacteria bacterium]
MKKFFKFVLAMIIAFLPGIFGVIFTPSHSNDAWYNALNNSVLTPDGWVFGVAWTILYALLGVALFLIMNNEKTRVKKTKSYVLFVVQMILNAAWTYLFFGLHLVGAALLCLVVLIAISVWMLRAFLPISKTASYLVWPYVIWMCFALYLNGTILFLN